MKESLRCPDCAGDLETSPKLGQGVWKCSICGGKWFILRIERPTWMGKVKK